MDTPKATPGTPKTSAATAPGLSLDTLNLSPSYDGTQTPTSCSPRRTFHTPLGEERHQLSTVTSSDNQKHGNFPPEIISLILQNVFDMLLQPLCAYPNPDPHLELLPRVNPYSPPSFAPTPSEQARDAFTRLALVDTTWGAAATDLLWKNVGFGIPRAFESVLRTIEEYSSGRRIPRAERVDISGGSGWSFETIGTGSGVGMLGKGGMDVDGVEQWNAKTGSLDNGLVTSPTMEGNMRDFFSLESLRAPTSLRAIDSPLLLTKSISFSRFRTAGLRRSVRQGSHERFVTPHRLLTLFRGTRLGDGPLIFPGAGEDEEDSVASLYMDDMEDGAALTLENGKLEAVGFTEFMDSAISKNVLDELLFRGGFLAEYEEPAEIVHMEVLEQIPPSPMRPPLPMRGHPDPFSARHLQSSSSRSPVRHHSSLLLLEEDSGEDDADDEEEDRTFGRGRNHQPTPRLVRRDSGAAFVPQSFSSFPRDESEERERGRDRTGRDRGPSTPLRGRGQKRNRSQVPPSAFLSRSSSVPVQYLGRSTSVDTERSLSVPASVRRFRGATKTVRVLEGSTDVKAIRALDLNGCVSGAFVAAVEVIIGTYHLGPPGLFLNPSVITSISEGGYDSTDDGSGTEGGYSSVYSSSESNMHDDDKRKLKRIFFPHLRRLGLASSLLPAPLLTAFVLSFPYLTHLDLTSTLSPPQLLKHLALAGQSGPGGRAMRLKGLSLARCRLVTGASILGLLCGDCPPFTSMASMSGEDHEDESWGSGEVVSSLVDLSLFGDATHPSPLSPPELRLVLTISPAFNSSNLRYCDLSSTPLTDALLIDHFPPQPHLIELGLANCRGITLRGVATFLEEKAPGVEILDLSGSCPPLVPIPIRRPGSGAAASTLSIMELHTVLLGRVASVNPSSFDPIEASELLRNRKTNLRVVELDQKALEAVQGGAGDWKPIWGKGRRGWYVDIGVTTKPRADPTHRIPRVLSHLPRDSPRRQALQRLHNLNGVVSGDLGWHSRKMEILRGDGMMGREDGLYAFHSYQT